LKKKVARKKDKPFFKSRALEEMTKPIIYGVGIVLFFVVIALYFNDFFWDSFWLRSDGILVIAAGLVVIVGFIWAVDRAVYKLKSYRKQKARRK